MRTKAPKLSWLLPLLAWAAMWGEPWGNPAVCRAWQTGSSPPAANPTDAQSGPAAPPSADQLLAQAIASLARYNSVTAKVRHRSELFGHSVLGSGMVWQGPARLNLSRLELQMQSGQQVSTLLQVCDGKQFWSYRDVLGNTRLWMIDLARVAEVRQQAGRLPEPLPASLGLGGLPGLLDGLQESMQFTHVQETRLDKFPVWSIEGTWKPMKLIFMLTGQLKEIAEQKPLDLSKMPEHMPDHVVLYLGRDDLFPYRLEYRRVSGKADAGPPGTPGRGKALTTLEFYEVAINSPIDPAAFSYQPGNQNVIDETDAHLIARGLMARKK